MLDRCMMISQRGNSASRAAEKSSILSVIGATAVDTLFLWLLTNRFLSINTGIKKKQISVIGSLMSCRAAMQTNVRMTTAWLVMAVGNWQRTPHRLQFSSKTYRAASWSTVYLDSILTEVEPPNWLIRQQLHELFLPILFRIEWNTSIIGISFTSFAILDTFIATVSLEAA